MTICARVSDRFRRIAATHAERPFLHAPRQTAAVYDLAETDYTYRQALEAVDALARDYARIGAGPGVRIGLALENRPDFFLHFLALNALGASILPLNCAMQADELAYQIEHSECALIVATPQYRSLFVRGAAQTSRRPPVAAPNEASSAEVSLESAAPSNNDAATAEAAILYTSGTTGKPKGCILSNEYFTAIGDFYTGLGGHVVFDPGKERLITPLPVTHMNALACSFMATIQSGGCLIQLDRFHPNSWWPTVRESGATIMHYLGVMPAMLLKAPPAPDDDVSGQIRFAFGAGCDPRHHASFEKRFGVKLIEAWAMTETGAGAWITASHEPRHVGTRCFGRAPVGLECRLVDDEGNDAPNDRPGELLVRRSGPDARRFFFSGYFKNEEATEEAWRGGWFHTGDAVRKDEDGYFYFVDRLKNVIRRSGENIAAIDVESVLMRHDLVAGCVVVPAPDEIRGEEVMALVVVARGDKSEAAARSIFDFAMENLAYYKAPGHIAFVDSIPLTASEKVRRAEAKEIGRAILAAGACHNFTTFKKSRKG